MHVNFHATNLLLLYSCIYFPISLMQVFSQEVTARQPASGHSLLQLAHPRAVPVLHSMLQQPGARLGGPAGGKLVRKRKEEGGSKGGRENRNCASWLP